MSMRNDLGEGSPIISLEDQAWADSCFVGDSEILENEWNYFKNALPEVDTSRWVHIPVSEIDYLASPNIERTDNSASSDDGEEREEESDGDMILDNIIRSKSKKTKNINPFRPSYNEHLQESENSDIGLDLDFFDFNADTLKEDIFKVWDLAIPDELEDELVTKQLIPESPKKLHETPDDFEKLNDLKECSLDDLIYGISDLSLGSKSN